MNAIIEMGGTKVNIFTDRELGVFNKSTISTPEPEEFKNYIFLMFKDQTVKKVILASFGPVSFGSKDYGSILNTPKTAWRNTNLYGWIKKNICENTVLVTDVTLPALGAMKKYKLQNSFFSYVTVGTGIGGCNIFKGNVLQNEFHPEVGHMYLEHSDENICGYHEHCFEGQTSGKYFSRKYAAQLSEVGANHPGRLIQLDKFAKLVYNIYTALGVEYIVLGGGAITTNMKNQLIENLDKINNSYLPVLNEKSIDQRLILDESPDDLALSGGMHLLDVQNQQKRSF